MTAIRFTKVALGGLLACSCLTYNVRQQSQVQLAWFENVRHSRYERVEQALAQGQDTEVPSRFGERALDIAVLLSDLRMVVILVENGASVNYISGAGGSPLHRAAAREDIRILRYLLDRGGNPNLRGERGIRPLHEAVSHDNTAAVELLLARGADPNVFGPCFETPMRMAVYQRNEAMIHLLHAAGGWNFGLVPIPVYRAIDHFLFFN